MTDPKTTERRRLDAGGLSSAYAHTDGMVCLDLWPWKENDPERFLMTPGQAMVLIHKLADAAQRALKVHVA